MLKTGQDQNVNRELSRWGEARRQYSRKPKPEEASPQSFGEGLHGAQVKAL